MSGQLDVIESTAGEIRTSVDAIRSDSHFEKIKKWLSPPDTSSNSNHARGKRHTGTGAWFLDSTAFREWRLGTRQHLWLYGIPGCGKTVLSSTVLDHLAQMDDRTTLDFFFDFSDKAKQKPDDMCRSLAFQLYTRRVESRKELDSLLTSHDNGRKLPTTELLFECLLKMMQISGKVCIIIDALDECATRNDLIARVKTLTSSPELAQVQVITTSRPDEEFVRDLRPCLGEHSCISIDRESVNADIRSYIGARLGKSKEFSKWTSMPSVLQKIQDEVGGKADGMQVFKHMQRENN